MGKKLIYRPLTILQFTLRTEQPVTIQSEKKLAPDWTVSFPTEAPLARQIGRWLVECRGNQIFLREVNLSAPDDSIRLTTVNPFKLITAEIAWTSPEGPKKAQQGSITNIRVCPMDRSAGNGQVFIDLAMAEPSPKSPEPAKPPESSDEEKMIAKLKADLAAQQQVNKHLQDDNKHLQEENRHLQEDNQRLQEKVSCRLDDMAQAAQKDLAELTPANQQKWRDVAAEQRKVAELQKAAQDAEQQVREVQKQQEALALQRKQLEAQKEMLELDCGAAREQLEELKEHLSLDADTLALLEDGKQLKHGSISKTLKETEAELEKVERLLNNVLKAQERYQQSVNKAILTGDGRIKGSEEPGGGKDSAKDAQLEDKQDGDGQDEKAEPKDAGLSALNPAGAPGGEQPGGDSDGSEPPAAPQGA